jgi:hypothetical protein
MATVFISYSRANAAFVRRLVDQLKARHVDYWLDVDRIQAGEDWSDAVWAALQQCDAMLLIMSPASMASKEVANEWKYYQSVDKPIIPVLVDGSTHIHYQLVALHYVDFHRNSFDEALHHVEAEIARAISGANKEPVSDPLEATLPNKPEAQIESDTDDKRLPTTAVLDPQKVDPKVWDRTTARIDRDLAKLLEDRLHHFDEQMVLEFASMDDGAERIKAQIRRGRDYVVGRSGKGYTPDVDLILLGAAHQGISRRHAALRLDDETLFIRDLNSTNYTYVEGKRLRGDEQLALKSGDRIQMGNLLLTIYFRQLPSS